ncbi:MAG: glycosyltransferase family 2 protein [Acidimicrobiaceae bacterium]|nr:glycosyltransferase family 2 protein [Acidimicrobiaceae bacterium]
MSGSSIVVVFADDRPQLKSVMGELEGSLSQIDELVVVNCGGIRAAKKDPFLLVPLDANLPSQLAGILGARPKDFVVLLAPGVAGYGAWLSELVSTFDKLPEDSVVVPRSAFCTGPQAVAISDASAVFSKQKRHRFSIDWIENYRGFVTLEGAASNLCLAVRSEGLQSGLKELGPGVFKGERYEDLFEGFFALAARSGGIYISHGSLVSSKGKYMQAKPYLDQIPIREDFPLVSGCLIVKNEEQYIGECLKSLSDFVDEIVVYDTGSEDATIELAEAFGAKVIRGYWDDDFGAARNRSLSHCKGRWILWIDADERVLGDPTKVRAKLAEPVLRFSESECKQIKIRNFYGHGLFHSMSHVSMRIFLRIEGAFYGALHERVRRRARFDFLFEDLGANVFRELTIDHLGYMNEAMTKRTKTERNTELAGKNFEVVSSLEALMQQARTYMFSGDLPTARETAIEVLNKLDDSATSDSERRWLEATSFGLILDSLILEKNHELAEQWLEKFEEKSYFMSRPMAFRARIRLIQERYSEALALFQSLPVSEIGNDGLEVAFDHYVPEMVECLSQLGRPVEAAELLLDFFENDGVLDIHLGRLVELMKEAAIPISRLARSVKNVRQESFYAQFLQLEPKIADGILEQIYLGGDHSTILLATAAKVALMLDLERMLEWGARLRMSGFGQFCPLVSRAGDPSVVELDRVVYAAVAFGAFSDPRAKEICLSILANNHTEELISAVSVYAPSLLLKS